MDKYLGLRCQAKRSIDTGVKQQSFGFAQDRLYGHKPINLRNGVTPRMLSRKLEQAAKPQARGSRMP